MGFTEKEFVIVMGMTGIAILAYGKGRRDGANKIVMTITKSFEELKDSVVDDRIKKAMIEEREEL